MNGKGRLNIYELYSINGHRSGFWVRRRSWGSNVVAQVKLIGGKDSGRLDGEGPFYGNPSVLARIYWSSGPVMDYLSCPGTYGYDLVAESLARAIALAHGDST